VCELLQCGGLYWRIHGEQSDGAARRKRVLASAGETAQLVQDRHHVFPVRRSTVYDEVRLMDVRRLPGQVTRSHCRPGNPELDNLWGLVPFFRLPFSTYAAAARDIGVGIGTRYLTPTLIRPYHKN